MQNKETGKLEGFDVELMEAIARAADLELQWVSLPFDGIITALQSGSVDAAISGITITAERQQTVDFSDPYFQAGLAIAVRQDEKNIRSLDDLKGKKIAVQIGTTGAEKAGQIPGAQVSRFDSAALALQELINGKVDAVINDGPVTIYAIKQAGLKGVKIVGELLTSEYYGMALPKNSPKLTTINRALGSVKASGEFEEIYAKWFSAPGVTDTAPDGSQPKAGGFHWGRLFRKLIFVGVPWTILLTALSFFFGLLGGTGVAIAMISPYKWLRRLCRVYVDFFRGTPMLVQLFIIYFGLPALLKGIGLDFSLDRLPAAIIALSLNVAAYLAEIMRGGIESIDKGQWEACSSLGMNPLQTMQDVIFPQAFRRMLPPLGNEFITLIKDTSLAAVIGFEELFRQGQLEVATTYQAFRIYIAVALVYLVLTTLASYVFKRIEKGMDPLRRARKAAEKLEKLAAQS
jgi:arginine/lysine/histidine/glutamine transport system substrate-binding/permease protein